MKKVTEVRSDYVCDQNTRHIDVWFNGNDDSGGTTAAFICCDTKKVIFKDTVYRVDPLVKEEILKYVDSFESNKFPNGFTSWQETHHEIVSAIHIELSRGDVTPKGKAVTVSEEQGTGGLYELAEELTDKFENLHAGREWDGEFFDEIEAFLLKELS